LATITAANAVLMLSIASLYPTPQQIVDFGVDDAFLVDVLEMGETQVGVDGTGVGGYVPRAPTMTIRLLATSISIPVFENWMQFEDQQQEVAYGAATIAMPSIQRKYTCYTGMLMRVSTMADVRKVLANREFHIQWLPRRGSPAISAAPM
jgi:tail fiber protein gp32